MVRLNQTKKAEKVYTHEGGKATKCSMKEELKRSVLACMLWEDTFYEDGVSITDRIASLVQKNDKEFVAELAILARGKMKLRHAPLFLVRELARSEDGRKYVRKTLADIIQRADELAEFLAIYWKNGKCPLAGSVKKGLADAFQKFNEYALAKYNRDNAIKLRDVLFMVHPKPKNDEQQALWDKLVKDELAIPDTWEVELSKSKDKKDSWTRLVSEGKLFALALLRNLRNMIQAGVKKSLIKEALAKMKVDRVFPYRFITAARYAPDFEPELEQSMFKCIETMEKLPGKTVLLVDVSGSMNSGISEKTEATRIDAACGLAVLARELCEDVSIYSFSVNTVKIPPRRGFALRDAINGSQEHGGTYLAQAIDTINAKEAYDRLIVFTDEQSHDGVSAVRGKAKGYIVNVASYENGVGYGSYVHVNGFSENVLEYIRVKEQEKL